jgi:CDP-paratose 2-epimerase
MEKVSGQVFNVGGGINSSVSLKELTAHCNILTGNTIVINSIDQNRKADIPIYITDNSKITKLSGWMPSYTVEETLQDILNWMKENEEMLRPILA